LLNYFIKVGKFMGRFLNPGNKAFQKTLKSEIYVDKTMLLAYTNKVIGSDMACICNSRPRRFGKSITANMLAAYYSRGCDSFDMFSTLKVGRLDSFETNLNKYDVIHIDVQWCMMDAGEVQNTVKYINNGILDELIIAYGDVIPDTVKTAYGAMSYINAATGNTFVIIIDEWDVLIRDEANNKELQEEYINFLRGMFKGTEPTKYIALAYLTGILPIKKLKTQSALNNFEEFTMLDAGALASYIGFTDDEVKQLCKKYDRDYEAVKNWYDGYMLSGKHVYNPKAVVSVMMRGSFQSYWSQTGTYESLIPLIDMDFDGLRAAIISMISGNEIKVRTTTFQNDMVSFKNKDDVLTLLIHLGYLAFNQKNQMAYIPNEELRNELMDAVEENKWDEIMQFERQSIDLFNATINKDVNTVAAKIEQIHMEYTSVIQYNDENSLSSVLAIAYLGTMNYYFKPVRELPTGRGFADFVYIPKPEYINDYPALVVELKWNKNADTAMQQIRERQYPNSLLQYTGNILLVAINYDEKTKEHVCKIEEYAKIQN
jgi:hypothetical protein